MDVGSLPQSVDQVGSFRYTTKISEYAQARLPIVTGRLPFAYDIARTWSWRLPGGAPWEDQYISELAALMEQVTPDAIAERRAKIPDDLGLFDAVDQQARVGAFIRELLD